MQFLGAFRQSFVAPPPWLRLSTVRSTAPWAILFVAVYVVLEWVSFIHEFKGLPLTPWNPGLGLTFACLMLAGPHYGIVLFAGVIIAEIVVLRSDLEWPIIVGIGAIVASGYTFVATATRKQFRLDVGLIHLRDVIILLLAAFVGSTVITLLLAAVLLAGGELDFGDIVSAGPTLIVGDVLGIAVTTPLVLRFIRLWREHTLHLLAARIPEFALFVVVIVIALWLIARTRSGWLHIVLSALLSCRGRRRPAWVGWRVSSSCGDTAWSCRVASPSWLRLEDFHGVPGADVRADGNRLDRRSGRQRTTSDRTRCPRIRSKAQGEGGRGGPCRTVQSRKRNGNRPRA